MRLQSQKMLTVVAEEFQGDKMRKQTICMLSHMVKIPRIWEESVVHGELDARFFAMKSSSILPV